MHVRSCQCRLDRRRALAGLLCAGVALATDPARAKAVSAPARAEDEAFMREALAEARQGDFPFGAVIVRNGAAAARGRNMGVKSNDPTAHGEMVAIRNFVASHPAAELNGATIYTTGEPCPMCMGAIIWCGFSRVVYGASIEALSTRIGQIMEPSARLAREAPFATIEITGDVLAGEALALFR